MQFKKILTFSTSLFSCVFITFVCVSTVFSQNTERERPKIKDFGKSLKRKTTQNNTELTKSSNNDDDVIKVETNLVRTDVLVIDQKGQAVLDLKPEDFMVTENDVPQEVGTFSRGDSVEIPRSIVLIIDYSGSQIPYIQTSVEAAKVLVDKLNPKDRMAIVTDDVELLVDFTRDKKLLKKKLDSLAISIKGTITKLGKTGKSLQYSALMATLNELFDNEDVRPIVIFQTDGDQFLILSLLILYQINNILQLKRVLPIKSLSKPLKNLTQPFSQSFPVIHTLDFRLKIV